MRSENDESYFVGKVRYFDGAPLPLANVDGDALLVTKSSQWSELRLACDASDARSCPIVLLNIR